MLIPLASRTLLVFSWFSAHATQAEPLKCRSDWRLALPPAFQLATLVETLLLRRSTNLKLPAASGVFCSIVAAKTRENQFPAFVKVRLVRAAPAVGVSATTVADEDVWLLMATSVATEVVVRPVAGLATKASASANRAELLAAVPPLMLELASTVTICDRISSSLF